MTKNKQEILQKILNNREQRFALRKAMTERGLASVSLNFNMPSYPKSSAVLRKAFECVQTALQRYFIAERVHSVADATAVLHSDCGDFYLQGVEYACEDTELKTLLEKFEERHELGRLLDIDLMNAKDELISSGKAKKCFLCDEPAKECMKANRHEYTEILQHIDDKVSKYLAKKRQKEVVRTLAEKALKATLFEVAVDKKPGLVCPTSNGSHTDMDYFTFLSSSASLANYWNEVAKYGYEIGSCQKVDYKKVRTDLRMLGLEAEKQMFSATKGINTQKGIIFLLGIACFSSAFVFAKSAIFNEEEFRKCVRKLMQDIVQEDFGKGLSKQGTHGEVVFQKYGKKLAGGARYEAEHAFPTVFEHALPYLKKKIGTEGENLSKDELQGHLLNLLLLLISQSNDINILYRKDKDTLQTVQKKALGILQEVDNERKKELLQEFSKFCMLHNISPGGGADLLALTLFIYFIEKLEFASLDKA
ncbi:MAG: triphosphoribosyl-dephospho-CoA synthase [Flavobacteriaceae bacterium]|nr:triphosphoribosyl-dephospho-CoA synthase [Flavobacteriaceae bacterium]